MLTLSIVISTKATASDLTHSNSFPQMSLPPDPRPLINHGKNKAKLFLVNARTNVKTNQFNSQKTVNGGIYPFPWPR